MTLAQLRRQYHARVRSEVIRIQKDKTGYPNFADGTNRASCAIAWGIVNRIGGKTDADSLKGQTTGDRFKLETRDFLSNSFALMNHIRPGRWTYSVEIPITEFEQYEHLAAIDTLVKNNSELASALGREYIITPDIVIARHPISDDEINARRPLIGKDAVATRTPFRAANASSPRHLLHASISCKWTVRSDRSQNSRTEALNLIRNRKGRVPHIAVVTAEPLPTRLASIALGTGDVDCVYHFALYELQEAIREIDNEDQLDMLNMLLDGKRLRDISDLTFDLAS